jgi:hypothetical protein
MTSENRELLCSYCGRRTNHACVRTVEIRLGQTRRGVLWNCDRCGRDAA